MKGTIAIRGRSLFLLALLLVGCNAPGGGAGGTPTAVPPTGSVAPTPPGSNGAPVVTPAGLWSPGIVGTVTAGPVCPVERNPPDPSCAPRPVEGAVIVASDRSGREVGRATTMADGTYRMLIGETGVIMVTGQPVAGLMGLPAPVTVTLSGPGDIQHVDLTYDTGIR